MTAITPTPRQDLVKFIRRLEALADGTAVIVVTKENGRFVSWALTGHAKTERPGKTE